MMEPTPEQYRRAVELAFSKIASCKAILCLNVQIASAEQSPQDLLAQVTAKAERGEALSQSELRALTLLLDQPGKPKRRGRPAGSGVAQAATRAARVGLDAVESSLPYLYRSQDERHRSRCDAVAEAMQLCGFYRVNTYSAVAAVARKVRAERKKPLSQLRNEADEYRRRIEEALGPESSKMLKKFFSAMENIQPQIHAMHQVAQSLSPEIRAALGLAEFMHPQFHTSPEMTEIPSGSQSSSDSEGPRRTGG